MNRMFITTSLAALLSTACVVTPAPYGVRVDLAPPLPVIVELGPEPYYNQGGYHYFYDNNRWRYSRSRSGPWIDLPPSHYPRETRYRGPRGRHDDDRGRDGRGRN